MSGLLTMWWYVCNTDDVWLSSVKMTNHSIQVRGASEQPSRGVMPASQTAAVKRELRYKAKLSNYLSTFFSKLTHSQKL